MKKKLHLFLLWFHFITLTIVILNTIIKNITTFSLEGKIEFGIEILTIISGLTLFFFYLKPFKRINFYFSIYATVLFLFVIAFIFRGIFWALVLSIILFPLIPDSKKFEKNGLIITTSFQGFMAPCCSYQIKKRQLFLFEKYYGKLELEGEGQVDFESVNIEENEKEIEITYSTIFNKEVTQKKKIKK